jgi:hypothetical protein
MKKERNHLEVKEIKKPRTTKVVSTIRAPALLRYVLRAENNDVCL